MGSGFTSCLVWLTICYLAEGGKVENDFFRDNFHECEKKTLCLGLVKDQRTSSNCWEKGVENCEAALIISRQGRKKMTFSVLIKVVPGTSVYGAIGISERTRMGDMLTLECVSPLSGEPLQYFSWFTGEEKGQRVEKLPDTVNFKPKKLDKYVDVGYIWCDFEFSQKNFEITLKNVAGKTIDLDEKKYYLNIAHGVVAGDGQINKHTGRGISDKPHNVAKDLASHGRSDTFRNLHATFMSIVFVNLLPLASIMARFFKETWTETRCFQRRIWFVTHTTLAYISLVLMVIAYALMAIEDKDPWPNSDEGKRHSLVGAISFLFLLLQAVFPLIIPRHWTLVRKRYYKFHIICGFTGLLLGLINIGLVPTWLPGYAPCSCPYYVIGWVIFHILTYGLLTYMLYKEDELAYEENDDLDEDDDEHYQSRAFFMYPMRIFSTEGDAPGRRSRFCVLFIFVFVGLAVSITLSVIIATGTGCNTGSSD